MESRDELLTIAVSGLHSGNPWALSSGIMIGAWLLNTMLVARIVRHRRDVPGIRPNPAMIYPSVASSSRRS